MNIEQIEVCVREIKKILDINLVHLIDIFIRLEKLEKKIGD